MRLSFERRWQRWWVPWVRMVCEKEVEGGGKWHASTQRIA